MRGGCDGRIVREAKVASEPEALIAWFERSGVDLARIGLEAGPLSQWLYAGTAGGGLVGGTPGDAARAGGVQAMPVKTDRKDAAVLLS